jgi:hypothetical protein
VARQHWCECAAVNALENENGNGPALRAGPVRYASPSAPGTRQACSPVATNSPTAPKNKPRRPDEASWGSDRGWNQGRVIERVPARSHFRRGLRSRLSLRERHPMLKALRGSWSLRSIADVFGWLWRLHSIRSAPVQAHAAGSRQALSPGC